MSHLVKVTPKNLYSNYSILTISEIIQEQSIPPQEEHPLPLAPIPFKVSQRKMLRTSKR
jgi:hypothetical protein